MTLDHPHLLFITGVERLVQIYGERLCFHDSEVHRMSVTRDAGDVSLVAEIDLPSNRVALEFRNVDDLTIDGFNHQNVLMDLNIENIETPDGAAYEVTFVPSYGVGAHFVCSEIRVAAIS